MYPRSVSKTFNAKSPLHPVSMKTPKGGMKQYMQQKQNPMTSGPSDMLKN